MMRTLFKPCFFVACFGLAISIAQAQTKVHAVSGTVASINPKVGMIEITTDDGSSAHFRFLRKSDGALDFDKTVSADAVPADRFTTKGNHVIVYYFGDEEVRIAVALHDLGDGSMVRSSGTVVKLNRKERLLTITNSSGVDESFQLDPKTVADTATGVTEGFKFDLSKGDHVQVTAAQANGGATALLIISAL